MLKYFGPDQRIIKAAALAEKFFASNDLERIVLSQKSYDYATAKPDVLFHILKFSFQTYLTVIKTYSPRNWLGFKIKSNVLAYTASSKELFINANNLDRSIASICGTICHELVHVYDRIDMVNAYGHGDNSSHKKGNSFPYFIGYQAKVWAEKELAKKK
jgi:hypothetical protein